MHWAKTFCEADQPNQFVTLGLAPVAQCILRSAVTLFKSAIIIYVIAISPLTLTARVKRGTISKKNTFHLKHISLFYYDR